MYRGWQLSQHPDGLLLVAPSGTYHGPLDDFNTILDALGPLTSASELASEAAFHALEHPGPAPGVPRPRAYICSPFAARDGESVAQHVLWAQCLARLAWEDGYWPVAPHLYAPQWLTDAGEERATGLAWGLGLLPPCRVVYGFSVERPSRGMIEELAEASRLSLPLRTIAYAEMADAAVRLPHAAWLFAS